LDDNRKPRLGELSPARNKHAQKGVNGRGEKGGGAKRCRGEGVSPTVILKDRKDQLREGGPEVKTTGTEESM